MFVEIGFIYILNVLLFLIGTVYVPRIFGLKESNLDSPIGLYLAVFWPLTILFMVYLFIINMVEIK